MGEYSRAEQAAIWVFCCFFLCTSGLCVNFFFLNRRRKLSVWSSHSGLHLFFFFKPSLSVNKHTTADVRNAIKKQYIRDAASSLKKKNNNTHIIYRREVVWKQSCGCQGGPRLCRPWTHKYDLLVTVGLGFFFFFFPPHMQQPLCHLDKYHPTSLSLFFFYRWLPCQLGPWNTERGGKNRGKKQKTIK